MPKIVFTSQHGQADLAGFERKALRHLARLIPSTMWELTATSSGKLARAETVLSMIPDRKETRYLHDYLADAKAEESRYQWHYKSWSNAGIPAHENSARLDNFIIDRAVSALAVALKSWGGPGLPMVVKHYDGRLFSFNSLEVEFNTTLAAGCDQLRLAAKLYAWAETHAWIADADRNWVADLIQEGLNQGIYRSGLWSQHRAGGKVWVDSGWGGIQDFLRTTRGPVVLYTSAAEDFPSPDMDSFMIPWPDGIPRKFDALSEEQRAERRKRYAEWNDLTSNQQWEYGVRELTENLSSVQISPATLRSGTFGPGVTLFDLFAEDRIERVESRFADFEGRFGPWAG